MLRGLQGGKVNVTSVEKYNQIFGFPREQMSQVCMYVDRCWRLPREMHVTSSSAPFLLI